MGFCDLTPFHGVFNQCFTIMGTSHTRHHTTPLNRTNPHSIQFNRLPCIDGKFHPVFPGGHKFPKIERLKSCLMGLTPLPDIRPTNHYRTSITFIAYRVPGMKKFKNNYNPLNPLGNFACQQKPHAIAQNWKVHYPEP
jgi:hypothetical protein